MMPGVLATANFGSRAEEFFRKLGEYQPDAPERLLFAEWIDEL